MFCSSSNSSTVLKSILTLRVCVPAGGSVGSQRAVSGSGLFASEPQRQNKLRQEGAAASAIRSNVFAVFNIMAAVAPKPVNKRAPQS